MRGIESKAGEFYRGGMEGSEERAWEAALCRGRTGSYCVITVVVLECELLDRNNFATPDEARRAVFEFMEGWYNPHRLHSSLDYQSPIHFERRSRQEQKIAS